MNISIIIPTWNEAGHILDCLDSAWSTGPLEVLVVDGGSQDGTVELARARASAVWTTAAGRARQQNAGARQARGEILLFLHADSRLDAAGLQQIDVAARGQGPVCGAFRQRIEAPGWKYRCLEQGNACPAALLGLPYGDQGLFVDRNLFQEVGGFRGLRLMEDLDLMWRLRRRVRPILLPGPLRVSARRWQKYGVMRQTLRNWSLVAAWSCGVHPDRLARFYPVCGTPERAPRPAHDAVTGVVKRRPAE